MVSEPWRCGDIAVIFRILIIQLSMIKSIILTSVISREFRQVLAWLNDERAFSSYCKSYSPADEKIDSSSLTLPRNDMQQKLEYIHNNPVEDGIVAEPQHYLYSSAPNYAGKRGLLEVEVVRR